MLSQKSKANQEMCHTENERFKMLKRRQAINPISGLSFH